MSLKYAILGQLQYGSASGYDLKKIFDRTIHHFWNVQPSQIYRVLADLEKQQLVTQERVPRDTHLNPRLYTITPQGKQELQTWLSAPNPAGDPPTALLLRLHYADPLSDAELISLLQGEINAAQKQLDHYDRLYLSVMSRFEAGTNDRGDFLSLSTLGSYIASARTHLNWLQHLLARIQSANYTITRPSDLTGIPS